MATLYCASVSIGGNRVTFVTRLFTGAMAGVTTDVCLVFPAIDAVTEGYNVQAVMDASGSPFELSEDMARRRMQDAGVVLTATNTIIAELAPELGHASRPTAYQVAVHRGSSAHPVVTGTELAQSQDGALDPCGNCRDPVHESQQGVPEMLKVLRAQAGRGFEQRPFKIRRVRPGLIFGSKAEPGFGPLAVLDHANLGVGTLVRFHEQVNDEILSYMWRGTMVHADSSG